MNNQRKRTWAEINLDNIELNYRSMRARLGESTRFLGVVKADGYGHGSIPVAKLLQELGCEYLAVAYIDEAVELRQNGITVPILIFGYTSPSYTSQLLQYNLTQTINHLEMAVEMSNNAVSENKRLSVHLKADSGMGRLGFTCHHGENPELEMLAAMNLPGLDIEGIYTHFAVSDIKEDLYTAEQFVQFSNLVENLEKNSSKKFPIKHCANSGAMINCDYTYMDMVRPGISLYGLYPSIDTGDLDLLPAMQLKTRIVQIKDFQAGCSVSYGRTHITDSPRKIAVISIGYSDGLHRVLSGKMDVLVRGRRAPQVGRICMDMSMIDVTDIPDVAVDDVVTVFGHDGNVSISANELAYNAGTISYEMVCSVSKRVPRVYIRHGVSS